MTKDILLTYDTSLNEQKISFLEKLGKVLACNNFNVIHSTTIQDSISTLKHNARIVCYIFDWEAYDLSEVEQLADINPDLPVFAVYTDHSEMDLDLSNFALSLSFLQYDQHLLADDFQRILRAINRYYDRIVPPFTKQLINYVKENKYTFCTPGHMGGSAFTRSPVGSIFYDFFGENTFKADVSISVPELGSLLDHSGLHRRAEEFIAETFNSDYSYIVTNGTSTANKMVGMFAARAGDAILVDRN